MLLFRKFFGGVTRMILKGLLNSVLAIALFTGISLPGSANTFAASDWSGTWYGKDGAVISISQLNGFIDLMGKDAETIYTCTGIIEGNANESVQCHGSGINQVVKARFIYRSSFKLTADGKSLEESWEGGFVNGKEIKWLKGKTIFARNRN
jgi:hypothetical protein